MPSISSEEQAIVEQLAALEGSDDADLEVHIGPDREVFHVHSWILRVRSPYFRALLVSGMQESRAGSVHLEGDARAFRHLLPFIYSGRASFIEETLTQIIVFAEEQLTRYFGSFKMVPGRIVNKRPLWKSERKSVFIYMGEDGKWTLCDGEDEMARNAGTVHAADGCARALPTDVSQWEMLTDSCCESWTATRDICVRKAQSEWTLSVSLEELQHMAEMADYLQLSGFQRALEDDRVSAAIQRRIKDEGEGMVRWLESPSLCRFVGNFVQPEWGKGVFFCLCAAKQYGLSVLEEKCFSSWRCAFWTSRDYTTEQDGVNLAEFGERAVTYLNEELSAEKILHVAALDHICGAVVMESLLSLTGHILKDTTTRLCVKTTGGKAKVCNDDLQMLQAELAKRLMEVAHPLALQAEQPAKRPRLQ